MSAAAGANVATAVAVTVDGELPATELGVTLVHEHVFIELEVWLTPPASEEARRIADAPVGPEIAAELRRDPFACRDNLRLDDDELAAEELGLFAAAGGRTVVDLTVPDIGRAPSRLRAIARRTGLQIVMGCGHYIAAAHPPDLAAEPVESIARRLVRELVDGVPGDGDGPVRAGVIGEIGTSSPVTETERRVLEAAALAQLETGAPLFVHLDPWGREGHVALDVLERAGVDLSRVALCHLDPTLPDTAYHRSLAERGATVCYDIWGDEDEYGGKGMPTDEERLRALEEAAEQGWLDRVAIAHDVCTKTQLRRYGGRGYAHLVTDVAEEIRRRLGPGALERLLVATPGRLLAWER